MTLGSLGTTLFSGSKEVAISRMMTRQLMAGEVTEVGMWLGTEGGKMGKSQIEKAPESTGGLFEVLTK